MEIEEGEPVHLECKVEPVSDNSLKIEWLRDGRPLPHGKNFNLCETGGDNFFLGYQFSISVKRKLIPEAF